VRSASYAAAKTSRRNSPMFFLGAFELLKAMWNFRVIECGSRKDDIT
jgi:hypothetical protein